MSKSRTLLAHFAAVCIAGLMVIPCDAATPKSKGSKSDSPKSTAPSIAKTFLAQNCLDCHDGADGDGGFDVNGLGEDLSDAETIARWERVFDRVHDGEMPPQDAGELDPEQAEAFIEATSTWISQTQQEQFEELGRVQSRRLTNLQLERTLQDLFAIDVPLARLMTEEPRVDGFTGLAEAQSMSHFQLESHLTVIDAALDAAWQRVAQTESWSRQYTPRDLARRNPRQRCRDPEMIDGDAVVWSSGLIFYGRITSTTVRESGWYRVTFSASAVNKPDDQGVWCTVRSGRCTSGAPLMAWVGSFEAGDEPVTRTYQAWLPEGHMLEIRPGDETLRRARFQGGQVGAGEGGPQNVSGVALHSMSVERIFPAGDTELARKRVFGDLNVAFDGKDGRPRLISDDPVADTTAQLRSFTRRAFRRPVSSAQFRPFADWLRESIQGGDDPIDALRSSYRAVLCSPRFMYFVEPVGPLDDHAIASRLSYLLWNSMPDWKLMRAAGQGDLRDPEVIRSQVDRMLAGPRGRQFVVDFADQWLDMNDIDFTEPDRKLYREFDIVVQNAMLEETHTFLEDLIRRNADARELIRSDRTFLNSRLARFYDIQGVTGDEVRQVQLDPDSPRGGLLGQGAVLKVTANGTNTSPVLRGIWVSERILGVPIPPPPESVPAVEPDIRGAKTIREQLQKHLSDDSCNSCHRNIDPPGYALENFDAAGRWRDQYLQVKGGKSKRGLPVDSGYTMADGRSFSGFNEFRDLVCHDIRPVARNFAAHLLVYGTGRQVAFADRADLDAIVDQARTPISTSGDPENQASQTDSYGLRSLIDAVVTSEPFLTK